MANGAKVAIKAKVKENRANQCAIPPACSTVQYVKVVEERKFYALYMEACSDQLTFKHVNNVSYVAFLFFVKSGVKIWKSSFAHRTNQSRNM